MTSDFPPIAVLVSLAALGLIMGSFLSTLALRLPDWHSIIFGRSRCDSCGTTLTAWKLIPLLGWAIQRGRCRDCGAPISAFYPLLELLTAAVTVWAAVVVDPVVLPLSLLLGWILLALAAMDFRIMRLSNMLTMPLLVVGLAAVFFYWPSEFSNHVIGVLAGGGGMGLIALGYRRVRRRSGLGWGDVKLSAAIGAWVGWQGLPSVILIAAAAALLVLFVGQALGHKIAWNTKIAFGSYLCVGAWIVWLYGPITWG